MDKQSYFLKHQNASRVLTANYEYLNGECRLFEGTGHWLGYDFGHHWIAAELDYLLSLPHPIPFSVLEAWRGV